MAADHDPKPKTQSETENGTGLDAPKIDNRIVLALGTICVALALVDPLIHKHGKFEIEHYIGFYAIFGFLACAAVVFAAILMRGILMRSEDYYDG